MRVTGKVFGFLVLALGLLACNSEDANDCLQTAGTIVQQEFTVGEFTKIRTKQDFRLLLKQGPEQQVIVETGENLLNDVQVSVVDGVLILENLNRCNLFREYEITRAIVTAPNITELRNASGLEMKSDGVLTYPSLLLTANTTGNIDDVRKSGAFDLQIDNEQLVIRTNGLSLFTISGETDLLDIRFDDEAPRLEAQDLIVQDVMLFHRGGNNMIVNPQQSIRGIITASGDVICVNRPPVVEVEERFTGRLIFQE